MIFRPVLAKKEGFSRALFLCLAINPLVLDYDHPYLGSYRNLLRSWKGQIR